MLNVIVEDVLSETVMRRLLEQVGFQGESTFRMMRGNGKIRQGMPKFAVAASRFFPHIVLTDLDRYPCPLALMETWSMGSLPEALLFRIAVHEVESWLMADRERFAASLSLPIGKVPLNPDLEPDAKQCLFGLIRKSRKRRLRKELLPTVGSHIGPLTIFFASLSGSIGRWKKLPSILPVWDGVWIGWLPFVAKLPNVKVSAIAVNPCSANGFFFFPHVP